MQAITLQCPHLPERRTIAAWAMLLLSGGFRHLADRSGETAALIGSHLVLLFGAYTYSVAISWEPTGLLWGRRMLRDLAVVAVGEMVASLAFGARGPIDAFELLQIASRGCLFVALSRVLATAGPLRELIAAAAAFSIAIPGALPGASSGPLFVLATYLRPFAALSWSYESSDTSRVLPATCAVMAGLLGIAFMTSREPLRPIR